MKLTPGELDRLLERKRRERYAKAVAAARARGEYEREHAQRMAAAERIAS